MRKLLIVFVFLLLSCGCATSTLDTSVVEISGKYICTNDYITSGDYFKTNPDAIPSITFNEDGSCEVVVNYLEGIAIVYGTYTVENEQAFVSLDLMNTTSEVHVIDKDGKESIEVRKNHIVFQDGEVKYMDDQYVFDIIDGNSIVIDKGFSIAREQDTFLKASQ